MKNEKIPPVSLASRGARVQFAVGVALIAVLPLLIFGYLTSRSREGLFVWDGQTVALMLLLVAIGFTGYTILRQYPINIVRLRQYLEQLMKGEIPESVQLAPVEDDLRAVETYLNALIQMLRERVKNLTKETAQLQEQLYQAQKMDSLGLMAAGIAHDFNNILLGIMGQVELISEEKDLPPSVQSALKDLKEFIREAGELVRQMMVWAGRAEFKLVPTDLAAVIQDMKALMQVSCGKNVLISYEISPRLPQVLADESQVRQVVMNLILNASDAIPEGRQGRIRVVLRAAVMSAEDLRDMLVLGESLTGDALCLEVEDNGKGMTREVMERIFDPFYSTKSGRRGLGLAVVLGIVKGHRGAIAVSSQPDKGTTFRVYFPVCLATNPTA